MAGWDSILFFPTQLNICMDNCSFSTTQTAEHFSLTEHFTILKPQNRLSNVSELHKIHLSPAFEGLKLWKDLSGSSKLRTTPTYSILAFQAGLFFFVFFFVPRLTIWNIFLLFGQKICGMRSFFPSNNRNIINIIVPQNFHGNWTVFCSLPYILTRTFMRAFLIYLKWNGHHFSSFLSPCSELSLYFVILRSTVWHRQNVIVSK